MIEPEVEGASEPQAEGHIAPSDELIRAVREALARGCGRARRRELAKSLHVADQADLLEQLGREERAALVGELKPQLRPRDS